MQIAINTKTFRPDLDAAALAASAAQAGFEAVELMIGDEGLLTTQTPQDRCGEIGRIFADAGVKVASLTTDLFWQMHYAHEDPAVRQQARDLTQRGLDMAVWLGTDTLVVMPGVVGTWNSPIPQTSYTNALLRSFDALSFLADEAEDRGVRIAVENAWNRFLLSPVEMREFIDKVNSPWVGSCLDIGSAMVFGYPQDWIRTLAGRIIRVHARDYDLARPGPSGLDCRLLEGSVDWPAVVAALREVRYEGPFIYKGSGEPGKIAHALRQILGTGGAS